MMASNHTTKAETTMGEMDPSSVAAMVGAALMRFASVC